MIRPFYILDENHNPVPVENIMEWSMWLENNHSRVVEQTQVAPDVRVSTVFLGVDHSWGGDRPILFETMIFGGELDEYCVRYSTWDEAVAGHQVAIEKIFEVSN